MKNISLILTAILALASQMNQDAFASNEKPEQGEIAIMRDTREDLHRAEGNETAEQTTVIRSMRTLAEGIVEKTTENIRLKKEIAIRDERIASLQGLLDSKQDASQRATDLVSQMITRIKEQEEEIAKLKSERAGIEEAFANLRTKVEALTKKFGIGETIEGEMQQSNAELN